jgi:hypothetical protein
MIFIIIILLLIAKGFIWDSEHQGRYEMNPQSEIARIISVLSKSRELEIIIDDVP